MSSNKDTKPVRLKPKLTPVQEVVAGYKFELIAEGKMPEGKHDWCSFCGNRLENYFLLKRSDGKKMKVGDTCVFHAGVDKPKKYKRNLLDDEVLTFLEEA